MEYIAWCYNEPLRSDIDGSATIKPSFMCYIGNNLLNAIGEENLYGMNGNILYKWDYDKLEYTLVRMYVSEYDIISKLSDMNRVESSDSKVVEKLLNLEINCITTNKYLEPTFVKTPTKYMFDIPQEARNYKYWMVFNKNSWKDFEGRWLIASNVIGNRMSDDISIVFNDYLKNELVQQNTIQVPIGGVLMTFYSVYNFGKNYLNYYNLTGFSDSSLSGMFQAYDTVTGGYYGFFPCYGAVVNGKIRGIGHFSWDASISDMSVFEVDIYGKPTVLYTREMPYEKYLPINSSAVPMFFQVGNLTNGGYVKLHSRSTSLAEGMILGSSDLPYNLKYVLGCKYDGFNSAGITMGDVRSGFDEILSLPKPNIDSEWSSLNFNSSIVCVNYETKVFVFGMVRRVDYDGVVTVDDMPSFKINWDVVESFSNISGDGTGETYGGVYILVDGMNMYERVQDIPFDTVTTILEGVAIGDSDKVVIGKYMYVMGSPYGWDDIESDYTTYDTFYKFDMEKEEWERLSSPNYTTRTRQVSKLRFWGEGDWIYWNIPSTQQPLDNICLGRKYHIPTDTWSDWVSEGQYDLWEVDNKGICTKYENKPGGRQIFHTDISSVVTNSINVKECLYTSGITSELIE